MLRRILQPLRILVQAFTDADSPGQLASGFALGMMLGLVPKGNLIAVLLSIVLLATRINLAAATLGALLFTVISGLVDPLTHRIGLFLLTCGALQSAWTFLYNLPLLPWTRFNNTVVLGSLALGVALLVPVYFAAKLLVDRYRPRIVEWIRRHRVSEVLDKGDKLTSWSAP
jgi:uncharacterized protein (TIGR03546 family)